MGSYIHLCCTNFETGQQRAGQFSGTKGEAGEVESEPVESKEQKLCH